MRTTLTKHKALETVAITITQCSPASSPIANLFIEISDYNTQTTTNKYISEDSLTNYYVTLHIGTQNYFILVKTLLSY